MNRKNMPLILMLTAGACTCIVTMVQAYSVLASLVALFAVMLLFYCLGNGVRLLLDRFDRQNEEKAKQEQEEKAEQEDTVSEDEAEYRFLYENDNVKAYVHKETGIRIELISKIYGTAEQIISQFDFSITKFAYYKAEVEDETGAEVEEKPFENDSKAEIHIEYRVIYDDKFFEHLHLKRLVIDDKIPYPMSTFERMLRYAKYGYFPCRETKMLLIKALRELDDKQVELSESLYNGMD